MSDLINRQMVIDAAEKESQVDGAYGYIDTKSIIDLLNDLPSAEPEWIPCSRQKHPDCQMDCYVTVKNHIDDYLEEYDLIVEETIYWPESECWEDYIESDVIAWMPKNEPKEPYQTKEGLSSE